MRDPWIPSALSLAIYVALPLALVVSTLTGCYQSAVTAPAASQSSPAGSGAATLPPQPSRAPTQPSQPGQLTPPSQQSPASEQTQRLDAFAKELTDHKRELQELTRNFAQASSPTVNASLRSTLRAVQAHTEVMETKLQQLEADLDTLAAEDRREREALQRSLAELSDRLAENRTRVLAMEPIVSRLQTHSPLPNLTHEVPLIEARVLAVIQGEDKTVLLSAGATSGVQLGYEFTIRRGQQPIAKVRVYKVGPGLCEARIVYHQAETAVVEGDEARTR